MTSEQHAERKRRGKTFCLTALTAAFVLSTVVSAAFVGENGPSFMLFVVVPSVIAATGFAALFWRLLTKRKESKTRGATAGILTGLCALPFAVSPALLFLTSSELSKDPYSFTDALAMIAFATMGTFFFGGFLAPIAGGIAGAMIAQNEGLEDKTEVAFD